MIRIPDAEQMRIDAESLRVMGVNDIAERLQAWADAIDPLVAEIDAQRAASAAAEKKVDLFENDLVAAMNERFAADRQKNAAYAERNKCVALIARMCYLMHDLRHHGVTLEFDAWRGLHVYKPGEEWDPEWRNVIYVCIPTGQLSWHIHESELPLFEWLPVRSAVLEKDTWDGHTTEEKYARIERFVLDK